MFLIVNIHIISFFYEFHLIIFYFFKFEQFIDTRYGEDLEVLGEDSYTNSRPVSMIEEEVYLPTRINSLFDTISYGKVKVLT